MITKKTRAMWRANVKRHKERTEQKHKEVQRVLRRQIATHMLNGMLSSVPIADRLKVDAKKWAKKAYEFADALIAEGKKK